MAINYEKKLKERVAEDNSPLTIKEFEYISEVEEYIDNVIKNDFDTDRKKIKIFLKYANFTTRVKGSYQYMTNARRQVLFNYLMELYIKQGWVFSIDFDNSYLIHGDDYLILEGGLDEKV